jgi:hypothetical protein
MESRKTVVSTHAAAGIVEELLFSSTLLYSKMASN